MYRFRLNSIEVSKVIERIKHIDEKLSYRGHRPLRWVTGFSVVASILTYANRDLINDLINNKAKNITHETIEDIQTKLKLQQMLNELITSKETKDKLQTAFQDLFDDPKSQDSLAEFLSKSSAKTMANTELKKEASTYLWNVIKGIFY